MEDIIGVTENDSSDYLQKLEDIQNAGDMETPYLGRFFCLYEPNAVRKKEDDIEFVYNIPEETWPEYRTREEFTVYEDGDEVFRGVKTRELRRFEQIRDDPWDREYEQFTQITVNKDGAWKDIIDTWHDEL